ncbi:hypothetical protein BKA66DRAFT_609874 [Pyrenochaeta sp. MPI-SDFR-AT-0127]|nr:hypothetical protein BKA66DRAFT_609874 [Pyrenochaeta sp. MPI-SDFR-AT-0127]
MSWVEVDSASRTRQQNRTARGSFSCGFLPMCHRHGIYRDSNQRIQARLSDEDTDTGSKTAVTQVTVESVMPFVGTIFLSSTRTRSVREPSREQATAVHGVPGETDTPTANRVEEMYKGTSGGKIKAAKNPYHGKHCEWRRQMSKEGARLPVQGRFRAAFPGYDEDT